MIHDPCIVPQLRSKKRERDDWFLVRMGCFNGDPDGEGSGKDGASDLGDAGEAIASDFVDPYDQDEAADFRDRQDESTGESEPGERSADIGDNQTRAVNIANIASVPDIDFDEEFDRNESPLNFAALDFPGGPNEQRKRDREEREVEKLLEQQKQADRRARAVGADGPDPVDIFDVYDPNEPEGGAASLTALRPDLARDPSRPPVSIVPAATTPAEQIIAQARNPNFLPSGMTGPAPSGGDVDLTPDFLPSAMTGPREARSQVYNVAGPSAMTMQGVDRDIPRDFDGGDVGDFSEFLPPEVQEKERERREEIRKAVEEGRPIPGEVGLRNLLAPLGLGKTILEKFTERDKEFARQANLPGNQFQTNAQGQITGVFNPRENAVYTPSSVGLFDFKGQEEAAGDLYRMQRQRQEQEQQSQGGDDPIIPPLIPEDPLAQDQTPEPVVGQNVITGANYQPREPVQFAYTGLPTLAPVSLQPTFQAQQQFTPTFGLGALRRS